MPNDSSSLMILVPRVECGPRRCQIAADCTLEDRRRVYIQSAHCMRIASGTTPQFKAKPLFADLA